MKSRSLLIVSLLFFFNSFNYAATIYVTETGAGSMNGTSWANAYPGTSLQIAINSANAGDHVWVACGTYKPTLGTDRTIAFSMKDSVRIYGSFLGTETSLSQRNISCGPCSILSGEIGLTGNLDNSYQVVRNIQINYPARLDGFIIRDGNDDRPATLTTGLGGGILNIGSGPGGYCDPLIINCVITNNQAEFGAGIFNDGYNGGYTCPTIYTCIIYNNFATGGGGGIDNFGLSGNASPSIVNCLIFNNTATDAAGGIYCWGGGGGIASPSIYGSVIVNNTVTSGVGGGIVADRSNSGGGVGGGSGTVGVYLKNSIIRDNSANNGPQFHIYESATVDAQYSDVDTTNQSGTNTLGGISLNNIFTDPQFLNPLVPMGVDGCWMTDDDGYQLQFGSPCIDSGDSIGINGFDLALNDRIQGISVDMGAYEFPQYVYIEPPVPLKPFEGFPNPVSDELFIFANYSSDLMLFNSMGQIIWEIKLPQGFKHIPMQDLTPGIYYLVNKEGIVQKLIKM